MPINKGSCNNYLILIHECRLKAYIVFAFGAENQSFQNKYGKVLPIRIKFVIRGQVTEWQRSGNLGLNRTILDKMGAGTSPAKPKFFLYGNPDDLMATLQWPIFTKFDHGM